MLTPNETLSEQHIEEMRLSGIPCGRLHESAGGLGMEGDFPVRVVEITKFTARRKGAASIPLDAFSGRNLLLVDEGHKGAAGKAYFAVRDQLGGAGICLGIQRHLRAGVCAPKSADGGIRALHCF